MKVEYCAIFSRRSFSAVLLVVRRQMRLFLLLNIFLSSSLSSIWLHLTLSNTSQIALTWSLLRDCIMLLHCLLATVATSSKKGRCAFARVVMVILLHTRWDTHLLIHCSWDCRSRDLFHGVSSCSPHAQECLCSLPIPRYGSRSHCQDWSARLSHCVVPAPDIHWN